jgi:hypothetical protein
VNRISRPCRVTASRTPSTPAATPSAGCTAGTRACAHSPSSPSEEGAGAVRRARSSPGGADWRRRRRPAPGGPAAAGPARGSPACRPPAARCAGPRAHHKWAKPARRPWRADIRGTPRPGEEYRLHLTRREAAA